jgi:hypothetical protein
LEETQGLQETETKQRRYKVKKRIGATAAILACCILATVLVLTLTDPAGDTLSTRRTTIQATTMAHGEPPKWIKESASADYAYGQAQQIMADPNCSREGKEDRMRVLQSNVGEELLATVVRYVRVYDEGSGTYISFDGYMREMAKDYPCESTDAPISYDPVGATMRIFFDPSTETIAAMTGLGLSPEEVQTARATYEENQRQREEATAAVAAELKNAWEQMSSTATDAAQQAQEQLSQAQQQAEQAAREAQEQLDQVWQQTEDVAREAQDQLEEAWDGLRDLFGW